MSNASDDTNINRKKRLWNLFIQACMWGLMLLYVLVVFTTIFTPKTDPMHNVGMGIIAGVSGAIIFVGLAYSSIGYRH